MATSKLGLIVAACVASSSAFAQASAPAAAPAQASGLIYKSLKDGSGASPAATDVVRVHYKGTFPDGKEFDSSYKRGEPTQFPLNRVIKCWTEGVQKMKVGGKAQLVCPPDIAYGARGTPGGPIPPNATLHFEIELLGIAGK
jgi:FKBP-type peptidyl-prolyl cis-trans isomerase FkpA